MRPVPRVRCDHCSFAWYGASAADGLRIVGSCPRCGGDLAFLAADAPASAFAVPQRFARATPSSVLGVPLTWAARVT